jgi:hypothetical protein
VRINPRKNLMQEIYGNWVKWERKEQFVSKEAHRENNRKHDLFISVNFLNKMK